MKRRRPEAAPDTGSGRPLLDRLGVKPGMRIALIGFRDSTFEAELSERGAAPEVGRPRPGLDMLFYMVEEPAGLLSLGELAGLIHDAGALWVLRVKGPGLKVREVDVIEAGKASGLVDNKIASFSDQYAAMRLVVPLARRGSRPRQS
ncbi:MAG: hypothetical protein DLM67_23155 [Candidatus Nephthysia bennettiae]|uniref:DUF3052 family protein n=1 Tax=Candidatus Nephthysia bennettiae TaxID=3127016 RepID=A0A934N9I3_9BACT|nr:DUF3052 family protein [Candidatus Dormibacteraeota bacterium]MBJ7613128.1 DUF3052 family protein [Candidatus Dormibacteraeota bacterium]PZR86894.1 MAG: hypothetical protein DLM67_23155 [Candidatus Dormibacteraeota bacterium]